VGKTVYNGRLAVTVGSS